MPPELYELDGEGVVRALSGCYAALKRRFCSVDFDDLINIAAPSHETAIREIIAAAERNGDSAYARKLRRVVFLRAAR